MIVNGVDLTTLGLIPRSRTLPRLGGERSSVISIPGGASIRTGGALEPGRIAVEGYLTGSSHAEALTRLDSLTAALAGHCLIRFSDISDREWIGFLQQGASSARLFDPQWIQSGGPISLEFLCPDPAARAQVETVRVGSGPLVVGTAPNPIRVEFTGSAITIRVRAGGSAGIMLTELVWSGANGAVVIDAETFEVSVDGANAIDGLTAASVFPIADPKGGADYIEVSVGAGATVRYRPRWS